MEKHKVAIVGAGPGDPELLTIKALKRVQSADVILYDALIDDCILNEASPACKLVYVGKKCSDGQHPMKRQAHIHKLMKKHYEEGLKVVRLKAGDPMIFGRGIEEVQYLEQCDIPWEMVPGISAGIAASSAFGFPLTERGKSRMVLFTSAYTDSGDAPPSDPFLSVLRDGGTVAFYMGLTKIKALIAEMEKASIGRVKVYVADRVSQEGQMILKSTNDQILSVLEQHQLRGPSIVFIGKHL